MEELVVKDRLARFINEHKLVLYRTKLAQEWSGQSFRKTITIYDREPKSQEDVVLLEYSEAGATYTVSASFIYHRHREEDYHQVEYTLQIKRVREEAIKYTTKELLLPEFIGDDVHIVPPLPLLERAMFFILKINAPEIEMEFQDIDELHELLSTQSKVVERVPFNRWLSTPTFVLPEYEVEELIQKHDIFFAFGYAGRWLQRVFLFIDDESVAHYSYTFPIVYRRTGYHFPEPLQTQSINSPYITEKELMQICLTPYPHVVSYAGDYRQDVLLKLIGAQEKTIELITKQQRIQRREL